MSFPQYSDFGREAKEAHDSDYDTDFTVRVNTPGPYGVNISTTTSCNPGSTGAFATSVNLNWAHPSGLTIDNLELTSCDKVDVQASLTNLAPGLTLKLNGGKAGNCNLGAVYNHQFATVAADVDVSGFSSMNTSVLGGSKGLLVGASASFGVKGGFEVNNYSAALGWAPQKGSFAGVQVNNKLAEVSATLQHGVRPDLTLTAAIDHNLKSSSSRGSVGATYDCCKNCAIRVKFDSEGMINAAVKREFPAKKFTLGAAAAVDAKNLQSYNFGVTASLG